MKEVSRVAQLTADNLVSIGASLSHVHVPGRSVTETSEDALKEFEVEIGMGIHNEAGSERRTVELPELVRIMLSHNLDTKDKENRSFLTINPDDEVVLLVNNLGGVSPLELGGITNEVVEQLAKDWNIRPVRVLSGTYMTSLNGLGFSISLLRLEHTALGAGCSMLELLDAPAEATGWPVTIKTETWEQQGTPPKQDEDVSADAIQPSNLRCGYHLTSSF